MATSRTNALPEGWKRVSNYCIRNGDYTICKIGGADGWKYELWRLTEQLAVNLTTSDAAIEVWHEEHARKSQSLSAESCDRA